MNTLKNTFDIECLLSMSVKEARSAFERAYFHRQLQLCKGSISALAKVVGMERTHLYRKLRGLGFTDFKAYCALAELPGESQSEVSAQTLASAATDADAIASAVPAADNGGDVFPQQPIYIDEKGVERFRANGIVRLLLDTGQITLNDVAAHMSFSDAERAQFAQLIGYSLCGYRDLSYTERFDVASTIPAADNGRDVLIQIVCDCRIETKCPQGKSGMEHRCRIWINQ